VAFFFEAEGKVGIKRNWGVRLKKRGVEKCGGKPQSALPKRELARKESEGRDVEKNIQRGRALGGCVKRAVNRERVV